MPPILELSDPGFWSLLITVGTLIATFVFRKHLGRALGRMLFAEAPAALEAILWEEGEQVLEGKKVRVKTLRKPVAAQLEALAPAIVVPMLKSIKINVPKDLPINPKTGQIDLLAPIASKLVRGGKVTAADIFAPFLPTAMQIGQVVGGKIQEAVQGFVAGQGPKPGGVGPQELTPAARKILEGVIP